MNFSGLNTEGLFTTAVSSSLLSPLQNNPKAADIIVFGILLADFLCYIDNGALCVLIRIASMRRFK